MHPACFIRFDQQTHPKAATHPRDWSRRRAKNLRPNFGKRPRVARQMLSVFKRLFLRDGADHQANKAAKGRDQCALPHPRFRIPERLFIPFQNGLYHGMFWLMRLQIGRPCPLRAAGPPRHLPHDLKCVLRRPQIRPLQPKISINYPNQCKIWKIMTFRHQLRANDNIRSAIANLLDFFF